MRWLSQDSESCSPGVNRQQVRTMEHYTFDHFFLEPCCRPDIGSSLDGVHIWEPCVHTMHHMARACGPLLPTHDTRIGAIL